MKDLLGLGVLRSQGKLIDLGSWTPNERLFLIIAKEFAKLLLREPIAARRFWLIGENPHCHYEQRFPDPNNLFQAESMTVVLEIVQGPSGSL